MTNKEFTGVENNTENNITGSTAKLTEGQSTDTASFMNGVRTGALALMTALTPSATTVTTIGTAGLLATSTMSCESDEVGKETQAQKEERWHQEAEAEATRLGWSQGVRSLAAGVIDYYYYKEREGGPLLIRLSYQVDVNDFINKIETDAKNRGGIYDPKTEGVTYAIISSLEGDGQENVWKVPSDVIYEAKNLGKQNISFKLGEFPSNDLTRNTIKGGLNPNKQMQIYSQYGMKNATKNEDRVIDKEKRGELKNIL